MTTLAVVADIHGNRWALEAVLEDLQNTPVDATLNLGDTLWGPLDPGGTADLLRAQLWGHVRGNMDRVMLQPGPSSSATDVYSIGALDADRRRWLEMHRTIQRVEDVLACHGTPASDIHPLLEEIIPGAVQRRSGLEVRKALGDLAPDTRVVLCGHTHVPGSVQVPGGPLVVNPGSVGLPAYRHDFPAEHVIENGEPHARYALLRRDSGSWSVEFRRIAYDWEAAAACAAAHERPDWAHQLRTGRVVDGRT
jgi:predicted phosphodiesterase